MLGRTFILLLVSSLYVSFSHAQNSLGIKEDLLIQSRRLYDQGQYQSVVKLLSAVDDPTVDQVFLLESGKMRVTNEHSEKLEMLLEDFPKHPFLPEASFLLGRYYFEQKAWDKSDKYLNQSEGTRNLGDKDFAHYSFMMGYLCLQKEKFKRARDFFSRAEQLGDMNSGLFYYQGLAHYYLTEEEEAGRYFRRVANDPAYGSSARYFLAQILFEEGAYQEVIDMSRTELLNEKTETNAAFYQLVGESYAKQDQAVKASIYFEKAIELSPDTPSPALLYQAGVARFKTGSTDKAIAYFLSSGVQKGEYAQLSAFQLGRIYVSNGAWELALAAYIEASGSSDLAMKEECLFQVGKLYAKQGNFSEAIYYFNDYRKEFKNGRWAQEVNDYLAEAYLRTSNYDQAIKHLQEVGIVRDTQKELYQKLTFSKAKLLFNDEQYEVAIRWLDEALRYPSDQEIVNDSHFLKGESYFHLADYAKAIRFYQNVNPKNFDVYYSIGYGYYNLFDYKEAGEYFKRSLNTPISNEDFRSDARLRLADCYYASKAYESALTQYQKVVSMRPSMPTAFQIGVVLYALRRSDEAKRQFESVLSGKETSLYDDALFQIAKINFETAQFAEAERAYTRLLRDYSISPFSDKAYLNRAVSRTNLEKLAGAKNDYVAVLENYPTSEVAFDAILGLQALEQKGQKVAQLKALIAKYKEANPDDTSVEVVEFESAKSLYFKQEYAQAVERLGAFVKEYPNSGNKNEALYYLGDAYYREDMLVEAKEVFKKIPLEHNNRAGRILSRIGAIHYAMKAYGQAIETYEALKSLELTPKDTYNARLGLLNSYYHSGQFAKCREAAEQILQSDWKPINGERNAQLMKGKSYYQEQRLKSAEMAFASLATEEDVIGAESSYYLARIHYDQGNFEQSLNALFELNSRFGSYAEWIDRSYLLIADNYIAQGELFQAKATLRSIVLHSVSDETKTLAGDRLNQIESNDLPDTLQNTSKEER